MSKMHPQDVLAELLKVPQAPSAQAGVVINITHIDTLVLHLSGAPGSPLLGICDHGSKS